MVDLIRQMPNAPWADEPDRLFEREDLVATDIWNMKWLLSAPRVMAHVVSYDGRVWRMPVPDPRGFAMFKIWLATEAKDREPAKQRRDRAQAHAVIEPVEREMPHLAQKWPQLKSFPESIVARAVEHAETVRRRG